MHVEILNKDEEDDLNRAIILEGLNEDCQFKNERRGKIYDRAIIERERRVKPWRQ